MKIVNLWKLIKRVRIIKIANKLIKSIAIRMYR